MKVQPTVWGWREVMFKIGWLTLGGDPEGPDPNNHPKEVSDFFHPKGSGNERGITFTKTG